MQKNPFAINFGKIPQQYIDRDLMIEEITGALNEEECQNPCIMLTGLRGTGKTVTMTEIEKVLEQENGWIVVRLNPTRDLLSSLLARLYDSKEYLTKFINTNVNLSKFGIGINLSAKPPVADIESALEIILKEIKKRGKRLLVTIDEVSNSSFVREFASGFQIILREELPIFLIMAGLYENIRDLENEKILTFLYRTPKYEMGPLNLTLVAERYKTLLCVSQEEAWEMAVMTRGYAFAYQALGKYLWEDKDHKMSVEVLAKYDEALSHYIYEKIWSELSQKDKWYMTFITKKEKMSTAELLEMSGEKKNEFSQYRARLRDKGLIDVEDYGMIRYTLPRFDVFVQGKEVLWKSNDS